MKNKLSVSLALLLSLSIIFLSCDDGYKSTEITLSNNISQVKVFSAIEDTLELCNHTVESDDADEGIENALEWLSFSNASVPDLVTTVKFEKIRELRRSLQLIHATDVYCNKFVTGLKITFALETNPSRKIFLLFQPVYLCLTDAAEKNYSVAYTSPVFLKYYNDAFVPASSSDIASIDTYRTEFRIKPTFWPKRGFRDKDDETGDTKSMIFPFQELYMIHLFNQNSPTIKFWNYSFRKPVGNKTYTKHSLLLSPYQFTRKSANEKFFFGGFEGKYADRAHLCPPSCITASYKLLEPCPE